MNKLLSPFFPYHMPLTWKLSKTAKKKKEKEKHFWTSSKIVLRCCFIWEHVINALIIPSRSNPFFDSSFPFPISWSFHKIRSASPFRFPLPIRSVFLFSFFSSAWLMGALVVLLQVCWELLEEQEFRVEVCSSLMADWSVSTAVKNGRDPANGLVVFGWWGLAGGTGISGWGLFCFNGHDLICVGHRSKWALSGQQFGHLQLPGSSCGYPVMR